MRITTFKAKTDGILVEVLRIKDAHSRPFESSRQAESMFRRLVDHVETDPWDGFLLLPNETVISQPRLGTTPLPVMNEEDSGDEEEFTDEAGPPTFESVEQARKFFSKNPWDGWVW
jgi:hypothetical protein